jgi:UDP-3-O-[3-hydroxymyristoyl] glucosamine N-acyltransferase
MKFQKHTLKQIATIINCEYVGDMIFHYWNEWIHVVETGDIVFVDHPKYYDKALNSAATIVLINKNVACPGKNYWFLKILLEILINWQIISTISISNVSIATSAS